MDSFEVASSCRGEGRANFGGGGAVGGDHRDSPLGSLDLKTTIHARELRQTFADCFDCYIQLKRYCDGGSGIADVVRAWHVQAEATQIVLAAHQMEFTRQMPRG